MIFSQRLKELRLEKGLTQDQLAKITELSHGCIAMLETEKRAPTAQTLNTLATFFECSTDYLLGREDDFGVINIQKNPSGLTPEEENLLNLYRTLSREEKAQLKGYLHALTEQQKKFNKHA